MGIGEIVAICATVGGAVWKISEHINNFQKDLDDRLDKIETNKVREEGERREIFNRLDRMETDQKEWFQKLEKELYKCTNGTVN